MQPSSKLVQLAPVAIAVALAIYGLSLLFRPSVAWVNPEYLVFSVPGAMDGGPGFSWRDLAKAFDPLTFDVVRPRFLNYLITALNVKFRLALYEYFIPPPNVSLMLIAHLLLSPLLLFLTVRNLVRSNSIALSAACLYVASVGFLSTSAFFVQPGKVLIHPMAMLLLWILSTMQRRDPARYFSEQSRGLVALICILNFFALSVDDTYAIVATVACVLFWRLFFPKRADAEHLKHAGVAVFLFFAPFVLFILFAWKAAPELSAAVGAGACNYVGFAIEQSANAARTPFGQVFGNLSGTALGSSVFFHPFPDGVSAVELRLTRAGRFGVAFAVLAILYLVFSYRKAPAGPADEPAVSAIDAAGALVVYFVMQSVLQRFHVQITGGYYYASLTAIFFSILLACLVAALPRSRRWFGQAVLVVLMAFQLSNFIDLNTRWKAMHMPLIPYSLEKVRGIYKNVVADGALSPTDADRERMTAIWKGWKGGRRYDLSQEPRWPASEAWFLVEMNALSGFVYRDPVKRCGDAGPRAPS